MNGLGKGAEIATGVEVKSCSSAGSIRQGRGTRLQYGVCALLLIMGSLLNVAVYASAEPVIVGCMLLLPVWVALRMCLLIDDGEQRAFVLAFSVCWFCSGISAFYAQYLSDPIQAPGSDAFHFFDLVSGDAVRGLGLKEISLMTEGAGAVKVWRFFYGLFFSMGFAKGPYIGITINSIMVSLTAIVGIKMTKLVYGDGVAHIKRFTAYFVLCGIFWLFASIHTRDAAVLLPVSLLCLFWVRYLSIHKATQLVQLAIATTAAFLIFGFLRTEFLFVPLAMLMAGLVAAVFGGSASGARTKVILISALLILPIVIVLVRVMQSDLLLALLKGNDDYSEFANERAASGSLGAQLIVNQPLPARLILGSAYLLIFPIPIWFGALDSAYFLFKSCNALFMYGITPLSLMAIWRVAKNRETRTPPLLFLVLVCIGFTLSIAFTSLESRHLGVFMVPFIVLAALPNPAVGRDRWAYRRLLALLVSGMATIHLLWGGLKIL